MKGFLRKRRGFTLLELLIVVVVLAILAGLALPQYIKTIARSKEAEGWQNLATIRGAEARYYPDNNEAYAANLALLDIEDPNAATLRYFKYTVATGAGVFTITATPTPTGSGRKSTGVRTLTLDKDGTKTETN